MKIEVDSEKMQEHISRICRPNLRRGAKICINCPFKGVVQEIMGESGRLPQDQELP